MTDEKNKDLFLLHKFTDRGGAEVYNAFAADDRLGMKNPLYEIRIKGKRGETPGVTMTRLPGSVQGHGTG